MERGGRIEMVDNWLNLHVTSACQLSCEYCYFKQYDGKRGEIPLNIVKSICEDFLATDFPLDDYTIILGGGEPLMYSRFEDLCNLIRDLQGRVVLSTNGILVPKYIDVFEECDGVQVSIDGDRETHDRIRGKGSYDRAIKALECLQEYRIRRSIGFTLTKENTHCVDHVIDLCRKYGCTILNISLYQPFGKSKKAVSLTRWLEVKKYASKYVITPTTCVETGCVAGICGIAVTPDLRYWDCPRNQKVLGRYPQPIKDVLRKEEFGNPFDSCCRYLKW